jgi:heterodisulfide reductase subunit B2
MKKKNVKVRKTSVRKRTQAKNKQSARKKTPKNGHMKPVKTVKKLKGKSLNKAPSLVIIEKTVPSSIADIAEVASTEAKPAQPEKYAFFIGCTIQVRAPYIERLARQLFPKLGIDLVDLEFSCCPTARVVKDVDINSWLVIAARNLALAEKAGLPILSMCTGCTQTLVEAQHALDDSDVKKKVNALIRPLEYQGTGEVKFFGQVLYEKKGMFAITHKIPINIAGHAGCHILRPSRILQFDNPENPIKLDELIASLGADPVHYPLKGLCCGYSMYSVDQDVAERIMKDKIASIVGADCMTVLCPTCFEYYQLRMQAIAAKQGFKPLMAVHYLQLLGLAMGMSSEEVGWQFLKHKDDDVLRKIREG